MNIEGFLDAFLKDVKNAGKEAEVDTVKGINFLEEVLVNVQKDLNTAGEIITIINPTLAGEVLAMSQIVGTIDSLIEIINSVGNKNNSLLEDYDKAKKDIETLTSIWETQKGVIKKVLIKIEKKAVSFSTPTINAEKKILGEI